MEESKRLITSWVRVKHWLSENFPETLENLYSPAFDSQIEAAEDTIGLRFPEALRTLLLEHNGEDRHWPPGIFPDGHRFLPTEDIVETWFKLQEYNDSTPQHWLPVSTSRAKTIRFLDFKPPQGGQIGQVAEVNFETQSYDVLANSFVEYIEQYSMALAVNKYAVIGDDILLNDEVLKNEVTHSDGLAGEPLDELAHEPFAEADFLSSALPDFELPDPEDDNSLWTQPDSGQPLFARAEPAETAVAEVARVRPQAHRAAQPTANDKSRHTATTERLAEHETTVLEHAATAKPQPALENVVQEKTARETVNVPTLESAVQPIVKKPAAAKPKPQPAAAQQTNAQPRAPEPALKPPGPQESGERLIIVGEMTSLMGKEEMLFTVETDRGKEYTFLAKAAFTKGFGNIGLDQYVRVLAKKFHGEITSRFIEQGLAKQPEYVAFDYVVLPVEKPAAHKPQLAPAENLDQIAHSILRTIQTNFQRGAEYRELKPEQSASLQSKFYNENTEKLLKLGFHYTADLAEHTSGQAPPLLRIMSFFDDGIVACFYHMKPRFSWPFQAARRVIELETELSDGAIIISTTAEDELEYPLPKTINRYTHPGIPIEGLLHKHRAKIRRYQTHKPDAAIVKVRSKKEFVALRQRRRQLICNHLKSVGWVTKEYVAKQFNNKEVAEQIYARIQRAAANKA